MRIYMIPEQSVHDILCRIQPPRDICNGGARVSAIDLLIDDAAATAAAVRVVDAATNFE